jgi:hypothetical protein
MSLPPNDPCPHCRAEGSRVTDSRPHELGRSRRRHCDACNTRWTTIEVAVLDESEAHRLRTALNAATDSLRAALSATEAATRLLGQAPTRGGYFNSPIRPLGDVQPVDLIDV